MRITSKIIPQRLGNAGIITLNNPGALHALTGSMVDYMKDILDDWFGDDSVKLIVLRSAPAKRPAFCAGGDVKAVYEQGLQQYENSDQKAEDFFYEEYKVNHAIATSRIPIVSLWDGVCIGGGVGLSIHGKYRIATENTIFSMPETKIGLFPDVGSTFWMPRLLSMPIANYVALVGNPLFPEDLLYTGLATHFVSSQLLGDLENALVEASQRSGTSEDVLGVLSQFHETQETSNCHLAQNQEIIEWAFDEKTVEAILDKLASSDSPFAVETLASLQKSSPTSLKITLESLKRGASLPTVGSCLQMEYRMARASVHRKKDFYEGVRAKLVDKDNKPSWDPTLLSEVTSDIVEEFFAPIGASEWEIPVVPKPKL